MNLYKSGEALRREMDTTRLQDGMAAIWALGQAGFLLRIGDRTIVIDPYLTNSIYESGATMWQRNFAPPISPGQLPDLDAVLISHHHDDHMDKATLQPLLERSGGTRFILPRAHVALMTSWGFSAGQLAGMNHGDAVTVNGMAVKAHMAMHDKLERNDRGEHLYLGYVIKAQGVTVCHTGDTVGFPELEDWLRLEKPDVLFIPINGRDYARTSQGIVGNTNYREAADLAAAAGVDLVIPMHYGMFPHNDENPAYFVDYVYSRYPQQKFHMMTPGERFIYVK